MVDHQSKPGPTQAKGTLCATPTGEISENLEELKPITKHPGLLELKPVDYIGVTNDQKPANDMPDSLIDESQPGTTAPEAATFESQPEVESEQVSEFRPVKEWHKLIDVEPQSQVAIQPRPFTNSPPTKRESNPVHGDESCAEQENKSNEVESEEDRLKRMIETCIIAVDSLKTNQTILDSNFNTLLTKHSKLETEYNEYQQKVAKVESRRGPTAESNAEQFLEVIKVGASIQAENYVQGKRVSELAKKVDSLKTLPNDPRAQFTKLKQAIDQVYVRIGGEINQIQSKHLKDVSNLSSRLDDVMTHILSLSAKHSKMEAELVAQYSEDDSSLSQLKNECTPSSSRIDHVPTSTYDLVARYRETEADVDAVKTQLSKIEFTLGNMASKSLLDDTCNRTMGQGVDYGVLNDKINDMGSRLDRSLGKMLPDNDVHSELSALKSHIHDLMAANKELRAKSKVDYQHLLTSLLDLKGRMKFQSLTMLCFISLYYAGDSGHWTSMAVSFGVIIALTKGTARYLALRDHFATVGKQERDQAEPGDSASATATYGE